MSSHRSDFGVFWPAITVAAIVMAMPPVAVLALGGTAAAGATIGLMHLIHKGKVSRQQAVARAKKLGIPDAEEFPVFVKRVLKADSAKRRILLHKYRALLARKKREAFKLQPGLWFRSKKRMEHKIGILETVDAIDRAARRARRTPAVVRAGAETAMPAPAVSTAPSYYLPPARSPGWMRRTLPPRGPLTPGASMPGAYLPSVEEATGPTYEETMEESAAEDGDELSGVGDFGSKLKRAGPWLVGGALLAAILAAMAKNARGRRRAA